MLSSNGLRREADPVPKINDEWGRYDWTALFIIEECGRSNLGAPASERSGTCREDGYKGCRQRFIGYDCEGCRQGFMRSTNVKWSYANLRRPTLGENVKAGKAEESQSPGFSSPENKSQSSVGMAFKIACRVEESDVSESFRNQLRKQCPVCSER